MEILLVIDMLNDFIKEDGALYCGPASQKMVPFVRDKIAQFRTKGAPVLFVADSHEPDDKEFDMFPPHCVKGTKGAKVLAGLMEEGDRLIHKKRYSAFYGTQLEDILDSLRKGKDLTVHVVGVCTNICVLYTVEELRNRDIRTVVYREGVASFDEAAHEFALTQMESVLGAELV
ncbi:cysteine hydrolase [Clostridia bacterium]|nr:cysteine hydrolase [Clostridia bacterium]